MTRLGNFEDVLTRAFRALTVGHPSYIAGQRFLHDGSRAVVAASEKAVPLASLLDIYDFRAKRLKAVGNQRTALAASTRAERLRFANSDVFIVRCLVDGRDFVVFLTPDERIVDAAWDESESKSVP